MPLWPNNMTTLKDIRDLIVTKIQGIKDVNNNAIFLDVFDYPMGEFTKYPSAVILPKNADGVILTTRQNARVFTFDVSLYQEQTPAGKTAQEANTVMTSAVDLFIKAFDSDKNLNFQVDYVRVVKMDFNFKAQTGPFVFAKFEVECEVLVQNY